VIMLVSQPSRQPSGQPSATFISSVASVLHLGCVAAAVPSGVGVDDQQDRQELLLTSGGGRGEDIGSGSGDRSSISSGEYIRVLSQFTRADRDCDVDSSDVDIIIIDMVMGGAGGAIGYGSYGGMGTVTNDELGPDDKEIDEILDEVEVEEASEDSSGSDEYDTVLSSFRSSSHNHNHNQRDVGSYDNSGIDSNSQQSSGSVIWYSDLSDLSYSSDSPDLVFSSNSSDPFVLSDSSGLSAYSSHLQGQDPNVGGVRGVRDRECLPRCNHSHSNSSNSINGMNDYIWGGKWLEPGEAEHMSSGDLNISWSHSVGSGPSEDTDWG